MKLSLFPRISIYLSCWGLVAVLTGCKTINSTGATTFATSVTTVKTQADAALNAAASLTRDAGVAYVATQSKLNESEFAETPTTDVIMAWDNALSAMETYALNLAALSSPSGTKNFDVAATNLFNQFTQTATTLKLTSLSGTGAVNPGLASGFTEVANLILQSRAGATALKIAAATDAQITQILDLMAAEIGADLASPGLRSTIYRVWTTKADALVQPFEAAGANQTAKAALAQQFATILAERGAEDQSLLALRRSLLALSDAHHALAQGNEATIQSTLTIVVGDLQQTEDLYNQFSSELK